MLLRVWSRWGNRGLSPIVLWSAQQLRGELFAQCQVLEERTDAEGAHFRVRGERKDIDGLRERIGQAMGGR